MTYGHFLLCNYNRGVLPPYSNRSVPGASNSLEGIFYIMSSARMPRLTSRTLQAVPRY